MFIRTCLRNLDQRGFPYLRVLSWLQIMRAEFGDDKLTGLAGVQMAGPGLPGELLFVDLLLQHHERVDQGLGSRRAAGDVDVDRDVTVDPFQDVVALFEWTSGDGASSHGD